MLQLFKMISKHGGGTKGLSAIVPTKNAVTHGHTDTHRDTETYIHTRIDRQTDTDADTHKTK